MSIDTGYIDGIRGLCAAWVVISHCLIWGGYRGLILDPKIAVDLFMVISGYLIALTYRPKEGPLAFYLRRAFRLLPMYYLALTVAFAVFTAYGAGYMRLQSLDPARWVRSLHRPDQYIADAHSYLIHLSMLFGVSPQYAIGSMLPDWSLTLEWQFYLCFPLLLPVVSARPWACAIAACVIATIASQTTYFPEPSFLPLKLPVFLIGTACCLHHRTTQARYWLVGAALLGWHCFFNAGYGAQTAILLAFALVFLVRGPITQRARSLLGGRAFKFLANTSYSAYLTHGFFIAFLGSRIMTTLSTGQRGLDQVLMIAAVLAGTYATSAATFVAIERPLTNMGKRLARRIQPSTQPELSSSQA